MSIQKENGYNPSFKTIFALAAIGTLSTLTILGAKTKKQKTKKEEAHYKIPILPPHVKTLKDLMEYLRQTTKETDPNETGVTSLTYHHGNYHTT